MSSPEPSGSAKAFGLAVAAEFRAEMARQRKRTHELAAVIGVTLSTACRRLSGESPFNVIELAFASQWLGLAPDVLVRRAELATQPAAVAS